MKRILIPALIAATLALTGCGGSNHHDSPATPPTTQPPPPPVSMVDAFFTAVMNIIGDGKETTGEPVATDSIAATTPDNSEPGAVK